MRGSSERLIPAQVNHHRTPRNRPRHMGRVKLRPADPDRRPPDLPVNIIGKMRTDEAARSGDCNFAIHLASSPLFFRGINSMKSISARVSEPEYWLFAPTLTRKNGFGFRPNAAS